MSTETCQETSSTCEAEKLGDEVRHLNKFVLCSFNNCSLHFTELILSTGLKY